MTLLNLTVQIVGVLCQDHSFSKDNFNSIKIDPIMEDNRQELIIAAMQELVENGLVRKLGEKDIWVLSMPPGSQGQEIQLSLSTCVQLAETINDFAKANKLEMDPVSPLAIHEDHISTLLQIIHDILSEE